MASRAREIDQFRHEAPGNYDRVCAVCSPEPPAEVYCFRLNFNISKHSPPQRPRFFWSEPKVATFGAGPKPEVGDLRNFHQI